MSITVAKTRLEDILPLRNLFLHETNFQIRYNACHERGWTDSYSLMMNGKRIGYAAVKGNEKIEERNTVFEFYIIPSFRRLSTMAFQELLAFTKVKYIESQTNDAPLTQLLFQFAKNVISNVILFEDGQSSSLSITPVTFRWRTDGDIVFEHKVEPVGNLILELNNEIIATGGFLLHYNPPFADLYMEVREDQRRRGFGSYLIQEIKRECYLAGRVPAARCNSDNAGSLATLLKAGMKIAGNLILGEVKVK